MPDATLPVFNIRPLSSAEAAAHTEALADILLDCVEGGASISFMWPLARDKALAFWHKVAASVARDERTLLVAMAADGSIAGTVQLVTDMPDNQPHRAEVSKMLVHRRARRQGLAQRLMAAAEEAARDQRKTVLVLDTATGGDAERLYQRCGWQRVGVVPDFALMPDGTPCGTTFFYKNLQ